MTQKTIRVGSIEIANDKSQEITSELVPMERLEKRDLTEEHKSLLEMPVRFHYKNGMVGVLLSHPFFPLLL